MKPSLMGVAWVLVAIVFVVVLLFEVSKWRELAAEERRAESERQRLTEQINQTQQKIAAEMEKNSGVLQDMQVSAEGTDPSAFLNRMAELVREKRMTVLGVGPLERQAAPQFNKSWHTIQVQAPYREVRELAARIEEDRGIIESLHLEAASPATDQSGPAARPRAGDEVRARFRMTALELTPDAKMIVARVRKEGGEGAPPGSRPGLALQVPTSGTRGAAPGRDPFTFLTPPPPPTTSRASASSAAGSGATAGGQGPAAPPALLEVKGIVSFPDGFLAIVNNQIVKVGDTVSGHRVERITESSVTVTEPGAKPQTINLPELAPAPLAAPKR